MARSGSDGPEFMSGLCSYWHGAPSFRRSAACAGGREPTIGLWNSQLRAEHRPGNGGWVAAYHRRPGNRKPPFSEP